MPLAVMFFLCSLSIVLGIMLVVYGAYRQNWGREPAVDGFGYGYPHPLSPPTKEELVLRFKDEILDDLTRDPREHSEKGPSQDASVLSAGTARVRSSFFKRERKRTDVETLQRPMAWGTILEPRSAPESPDAAPAQGLSEEPSSVSSTKETSEIV